MATGGASGAKAAQRDRQHQPQKNGFEGLFVSFFYMFGSIWDIFGSFLVGSNGKDSQEISSWVRVRAPKREEVGLLGRIRKAEA